MVAGLRSKAKIGFIIQARMRSERLPGKVLMPIPIANGKPLIQWIVNELRKCSIKNEIILATSTNAENDALYEYCLAHSIRCFRGYEDDVLSRFIEIAKINNFDAVVRLTGDNPIIDISLLEEAIEYHLLNRNDYSYTNGLPLGMNFEIISPYTLLSLEGAIMTYEEKEHVTLFIRKSDKFIKGEITLSDNIALRNIRLTVDYPSDYLVVSQVITYCDSYSSDKISGIEKILTDYPWIFAENAKNIQKSI